MRIDEFVPQAIANATAKKPKVIAEETVDHKEEDELETSLQDDVIVQPDDEDNDIIVVAPDEKDKFKDKEPIIQVLQDDDSNKTAGDKHKEIIDNPVDTDSEDLRLYDLRGPADISQHDLRDPASISQHDLKQIADSKKGSVTTQDTVVEPNK